MRRFFASTSSEFKKFFNWKVVIIFALLIIVLALISMPVFEKFHGYEFSEDSYSFNRERIEQKYEFAKKAYEENPITAQFYEMKYYEYLLENEVITDNMVSFNNSKGNFLNYVGMFVYGLFALVIIYGGMIMSKEYTSKSILPLSCVPLKKRYIIASKFLVVAVFSLLMVFLFFTVIAFAMLKYGGTGKIFVMQGFLSSFKIHIVSYAQAVCVSAILTWFVCLTLGAFGMLVSTIIKNIYISIPGSLLLSFIPIFISNIEGDIKGFQALIPSYNVFYHNYTNPLNARSVINTVGVFIAINIISAMIIFLVNAVIFERRQVKE